MSDEKKDAPTFVDPPKTAEGTIYVYDQFGNLKSVELPAWVTAMMAKGPLTNAQIAELTGDDKKDEP